VVPALALTVLADLLWLAAGQMDYATIRKADLLALFPMFWGLIYGRCLETMVDEDGRNELVPVDKGLQFFGVVNGITIAALSFIDAEFIKVWGGLWSLWFLWVLTHPLPNTEVRFI
jgi:hypothetical protein